MMHYVANTLLSLTLVIAAIIIFGSLGEKNNLIYNLYFITIAVTCIFANKVSLEFIVIIILSLEFVVIIIL